MKMPKGYTTLDSDIPEGHQYNRISDALQLMKEMAEALEYYADPVSYELRWKVLNIKESVRYDRPQDEQGVRAIKVLEKFKEWEE